MSIMTGGGDEGDTGLWSGERVRKDDARVEAYGTIDELDSLLGEARHFLKRADTSRTIDDVQADLFRVGGELATQSGVFPQAMGEADVRRIEEYASELEAELRLSGFVLPGSTLQSAKLDVARTVCRRAERRIVTLARLEPVSKVLLRYVNRLSDLIFLMARAEEKSEGRIRYVKR